MNYTKISRMMTKQYLNAKNRNSPRDSEDGNEEESVDKE